MNDRLYLDHNATTPPADEVVEAMAHCQRQTWANASSTHGPGQEAKLRLSAARQTLAAALGCRPDEIVFTSGATEANHAAVWGALALARERRRWVLSAVEHAAHLALARRCNQEAWAGQDVRAQTIAVRPDGALDVDAAHKCMGADLALVSVMAANNETGALMPWRDLVGMAHQCGALLHVDATQWIGKLPFDFASCGADLVSLSAHKWQGPKGVGALLVRKGLRWPAWVSGSQERRRRGGTENLPAIVGMARAAQLHLGAAQDLGSRAHALACARDLLEARLAQGVPGLRVFGQGVERLPNTSMWHVPGVHADAVLQRLDRAGIAASSGSACSAGGSDPSHVLLAMGVPAEDALGAVRLSLSMQTRQADIERMAASIVSALSDLPRENRALDGPSDSTPTVCLSV